MVGRNLYYYFVISSNSPSTDPVLLWMNGGPGCSSFDGFIYEHGCKHHLFESPVGVGFSYQNVTPDYSTDDLKTAKDVHSFLLKWFEEYSEFQSNAFYVAGESYAGVYVPTVVQEIVTGRRNDTMWLSPNPFLDKGMWAFWLVYTPCPCCFWKTKEIEDSEWNNSDHQFEGNSI
ncbi:hypothetical protein L7F22_061190 [Adiantum nelumboides]|nr:hypothetical protein [Adiantum nelumboides]